MMESRQDLFLKKKFKQFNYTLFNKKITIIGCGGVGSILVELLARGGFKNIKVIDNDIVDKTNLQRQNFIQNDLGKLKIDGIKKRIHSIDSKYSYVYFASLINEKNIKEFCVNSDLIIDSTDNFETRKIINSYCEKTNNVWLYTGAIKSEVSCCLFEGEKKLFSKTFSNEIVNESCCNVGVLSSTTFCAASIAYNQILKYFLNESKKELIKLDLWTNKLHLVNLK